MPARPAAKAAFPTWMKTPAARKRIALVEKLLEILQGACDEMALAMTAP